ncbi:monovalent cation/H(+) antiporter subunit G [Corynebacterium flavescens]|uniref:monovalent cation/H(+) antiporter subunit G n=1 Tax=Corynebacterium flavescens TaxID=28028 RepID=UPI003FCF1BA6
MNIELITDIVSLVFILAGSAFALSAAIGVARFRDTMSRVHSVSKPQTTGLILTIIGALIRVVGSGTFSIAEKGDLGILILLVIFAMITSPVTAQRISRIARREGLYGTDDSMSRNDRPAAKSLRKK